MVRNFLFLVYSAVIDCSLEGYCEINHVFGSNILVSFD